jgi:nucleoid-associated protein YgaU
MGQGGIALVSAGGAALPEPVTTSDPAKPKAAGGRGEMVRASIGLYAPDPAPGGAKPGADKGSIKFQFNPKEVTIQKSAKWERKPASGSKSAGPPAFIGAEPCKLTVEMFFDATDTKDGSVVPTVDKLFWCCVPTEMSADKKKPSPPLVVLHWGTVSSFPGFITSVSAKYTLFRSDGTPIRAVCSVSIEEMPGEPYKQNPTSGGREVRRVHRTVAGDTLASVAYAEYGDPNQWRALAAYNDIADPLRVRAGTVLLMPPADELEVAR